MPPYRPLLVALKSLRLSLDDFAQVDPEEINALLEQLFKQAIKYKIFYNHQNILGVKFGLACDGFVVHAYHHPHSVNEKGENACPYCLERTRNKGTSDLRTCSPSRTITRL